ncbi:serine/threonine-protein phosphatase 1 regulatory subunit 10 [Cydia splendana]|uniref:serine/threonine-protein phosphatase 1 regulatory subunit 10 n=1 Tax=Cydia splendana TaxID=1100963 RepID=UPI002132FC94
MPRIDPIQLLNCLSVLLSPDGGIKSRDEVQRLANLMTKFSKKLVSKCIYIQILKCTETDLLGLFMGSGGWRLVHMWLTESIVAKNWPLVRELLELLLLCPVDIEHLKTNNCPKLVKELSKEGNQFAIRALASKLVEQWLKTVKGEPVIPVQSAEIPQIILDAQKEINTDLATKSEVPDFDKTDQDEFEIKPENVKQELSTEKIESNGLDDKKEVSDKEKETLPVLKITLKDGKQILSQLDDADNKVTEKTSDKEKPKDRHKSKSKDKEKSHDSSSKSSSSKHSSKSVSSSDKHRNSKSDSPSHHSSKDKSKDKSKHSSHSSKTKSDSGRRSSSEKSSSSSSKSKEERSSKSSSEKSKSKEKTKDDKSEKKKESSEKTNEKSDEKPGPPSIHKLGKIPKLSDVKKEKPSISIEIRKPDEPKPKTVKTFHSKFRKHGLEEEVKPPPSRASLLNKKPPPPALPPTVSIPKRPSPVHNETPPEKKPKTVEPVEKPGAIKLIPPKPKPMLLLESDMFMDALNASATNKKEPKKRKRRTSGSKDGNASTDGSPPHTPNSITSPTSENKSVPPRFYQDTLDTEEDKDKSSDKVTDSNDNKDTSDKEAEESMDTAEPHTLTVNGLKGVLCYHKKKGPKKSIKWKPEPELEEIQYFELDETERVNVTKTFTDMKYLERIHERDAFQKGRNLSSEDVMGEKTSWKPLIPIDTKGQVHVDHGKNSKEKDIQAIRQKGTLQPLYFHKSMIPDSPLEPDTETHTYSEPTTIPLEDVTGNQDTTSDFRNMPWPEPKGNAPPVSSSNINMPAMFPSNMTQFPNGFPPTPFPGAPGFQGPPGMGPGDWQNGVPPQMMPNGMPPGIPPGALAPGVMPPANMPPGIMMTPESMMMTPEMFVGGPNGMFPPGMVPDGFNMQPNMFPPDFNMTGPQGPPGADGFSGPGNFRGSMRGRGSSGHWRGKNSGNWDGPQRGRGGHSRGSKRPVCIYFQRKGSCRQGDNCTFLHPGVNCPY